MTSTDLVRVVGADGKSYQVPADSVLDAIGGGTQVAVDDELSLESENPVQNKVITAALNDKADLIFNTVSGSIAHFDDGLAMDAVEVIAHINPVQSGSGDPSPDNVRPISGHTGCDITRTGKNLLRNGIVPSTNTNPYTFASSEFFKAGTYTISFQNTTATSWRYYVRGFDAGGNILPDGFMSGSGMTYRTDFKGYLSGANITNLSRNITLNIDCNLCFGLMNGDVTGNTTVSGAQFELGSAASSYEPYNGTTSSITWQTEAGTVYGGYATVDEDGSVDLVAGYQYVVPNIDLLQSTNQYNITNWRFNLSRAGLSSGVLGSLCNMFTQQTTTIANTTTEGFMISNDYGYLRLNANRASTKEQANDWIATNGLYIVYKLATPITYHLANIDQIETLFGTNNVWNTANGDTDVTYKADTKLYIDSRILEALNT